MDTMKVEVLEEHLRDECIETGRRYDLEKGDIATVEESLGLYWCRHGWAKDVSGAVETGERIVRGVQVQPQSARHDVSDTNGEG